MSEFASALPVQRMIELPLRSETSWHQPPVAARIVDRAVDDLVCASQDVWRNTDVRWDQPEAIAAVLIASSRRSLATGFAPRCIGFEASVSRLVAYLAASGSTSNRIFAALSSPFVEQHAARLARPPSADWERCQRGTLTATLNESPEVAALGAIAACLNMDGGQIVSIDPARAPAGYAIDALRWRGRIHRIWISDGTILFCTNNDLSEGLGVTALSAFTRTSSAQSSGDEPGAGASAPRQRVASGAVALARNALSSLIEAAQRQGWLGTAHLIGDSLQRRGHSDAAEDITEILLAASAGAQDRPSVESPKQPRSRRVARL